MIIKKSDLKLLASNDPILKIRPSDFKFDGEIDPVAFSNIMFDKMIELGGIGLSANQVGVDARMFVMGTEDVRMNVFNPEILEQSKELEHMNEGCLSFPGLTLGVSRSRDISVKFQNEKSEWCHMKLSGITARVFLHEYDHMQGMVFTQWMTPFKLEYYLKKQKNKKEKLVKKYASKIVRDIVNDLNQ